MTSGRAAAGCRDAVVVPDAAGVSSISHSRADIWNSALHRQ